MSRFVTVLSVAAILLLAANAAFATGFQTGNGIFPSATGTTAAAATAKVRRLIWPTGPTATTDGGIWIKTGSTYELNWQDVNIELDFRTAPGQPSVVITNTMLLSTGVAAHDVNQGDGSSESTCWYPGYFSNEYNGSGSTRDVNSPYLVTGNTSNNMYWLPTALNADPTNFQFDLYFWQGMETSYAAPPPMGRTSLIPVGLRQGQWRLISSSQPTARSRTCLPCSCSRTRPPNPPRWCWLLPAYWACWPTPGGDANRPAWSLPPPFSRLSAKGGGPVGATAAMSPRRVLLGTVWT